MDYSDLDDAALDAKIIELRTALEGIALGGGVAVVAGEGRRVEYTRANGGQLRQMYDAAVREKARRSPDSDIGALLVEF